MGLDWLVKELTIAKQQGRITEEQWKQYLLEAAQSDARIDEYARKVREKSAGGND